MKARRRKVLALRSLRAPYLRNRQFIRSCLRTNPYLCRTYAARLLAAGGLDVKP